MDQERIRNRPKRPVYSVLDKKHFIIKRLFFSSKNDKLNNDNNNDNINNKSKAMAGTAK